MENELRQIGFKEDANGVFRRLDTIKGAKVAITVERINYPFNRYINNELIRYEVNIASLKMFQNYHISKVSNIEELKLIIDKFNPNKKGIESFYFQIGAAFIVYIAIMLILFLIKHQ